MTKFYSIYDAKAGFYNKPFLARTKGEALRMFQQAANDTQTQIGLYPEDFILYEIGTFNDLTGDIAHETHISLGKAIDYVRVNQTIKHVSPDTVSMEGRN